MTNVAKSMVLFLMACLVVAVSVSIAGTSVQTATAPTLTHQALTPTLRKVFATNLRACTAEDTSLMLSTVHPKSPSYTQTAQVMKQLFARHDLNYELLSFSFVGKDRDYAVIRAKQKTTKMSGPAFRDNILDAMHIFRKDGSTWKLWQTAVLDVQVVPTVP